MDDQGDAYYAVIFTAEMTGDMTGYADTAGAMARLVEKQAGYIGMYHSIEDKPRDHDLLLG